MEATDYLRFVLALAVVLGLIMALSWGLKRIGGVNPGLTAKRRLRTIESTAIDSRHRIVLVRRDTVEHLVLIGPASAQVIETGIPASADEPAAGGAPPTLTEAFKNVLQAATGAKS